MPMARGSRPALQARPVTERLRSVVYQDESKIWFTASLSSETVLRLVEDLHRANRATFLFTQQECFLVNTEVGGKDWGTIASKYDKAVEDVVDRREEILAKVASGHMDIIKVTACADPERVSELLEHLAVNYPEFAVTRAIPFILEVHDPTINKGTALDLICAKLGVSTKNCLVFGDGENDIAMFQKAGYSVAMANGMEAAKEAASYLTISNDEGGVGAFLDRIFR